MDAQEYNRLAAEAGRLSAAHIVRLFAETGRDLEAAVRAYQRRHGLAPDGKLGPITVGHLERPDDGVRKIWPLPRMPDGREPVITSRFKTNNPDRPTHNGIDFFYVYLPDDPVVRAGDGGAIVRHGLRRWWYPPGTQVLAAADGTVQAAGPGRTGHLVWIQHEDGYRSGYFHLRSLLVEPGQDVKAGDPIGTPGDNPQTYDATHLHFEVSRALLYHPVDPEVWLRGATYAEAT